MKWSLAYGHLPRPALRLAPGARPPDERRPADPRASARTAAARPAGTEPWPAHGCRCRLAGRAAPAQRRAPARLPRRLRGEGRGRGRCSWPGRPPPRAVIYLDHNASTPLRPEVAEVRSPPPFAGTTHGQSEQRARHRPGGTGAAGRGAGAGGAGARPRAARGGLHRLRHRGLRARAVLGLGRGGAVVTRDRASGVLFAAAGAGHRGDRGVTSGGWPGPAEAL